jgi:hypothetical protein
VARVATTKILTVPNLLSVLRLFGVPLFLYLVLGPEADGWAVVVLAVSGATDYLDGVIARRFGQESALGRLLDPAVDRLYILVVIVGLAVRDIVPWWLVGGCSVGPSPCGVAASTGGLESSTSLRCASSSREPRPSTPGSCLAAASAGGGRSPEPKPQASMKNPSVGSRNARGEVREVTA